MTQRTFRMLSISIAYVSNTAIDVKRRRLRISDVRERRVFDRFLGRAVTHALRVQRVRTVVVPLVVGRSAEAR